MTNKISFFQKYLIQKWWLPLLIYIIGILPYVYSVIKPNDTLALVTDIGLLIITFLFFLVIIYQLSSGKILLGTVQLFLLIAFSFGLMFFTSTVLLFRQEEDTFADDLKIPENIDFKKPIDLNFDTGRPDSLLNLKKDTFHFQLYNSFQPGLYEYDAWLKSDTSGTLYLKAFEITKNQALSTDRMLRSSRISTHKTRGKFKKFSTEEHFTIYEGVWGKPYGARFEVWYESDDTGEAIKIFEDNYIIEGWMR